MQMMFNLKLLMIMLTLAAIAYVFMCWISNWNLLWPLTLLLDGALVDELIAIGWAACLIAGLN
jgi:hypothetical protein